MFLICLRASWRLNTPQLEWKENLNIRLGLPITTHYLIYFHLFTLYTGEVNNQGLSSKSTGYLIGNGQLYIDL